METENEPAPLSSEVIEPTDVPNDDVPPNDDVVNEDVVNEDVRNDDIENDVPITDNAQVNETVAESLHSLQNEIEQSSTSEAIMENDAIQLENDQVELVAVVENEVKKSLDLLSSIPEVGEIYDLDPYATYDNSQFTSTITRLIESPEPLIRSDQFLFVNIDYSAGDNDEYFELFSLHESNEPETANANTSILFMRPDSPTFVSEPIETIEPPIEDVVLEESKEIEQVVPEPVQEKIDREAYIAKIKMNLIAQDKSKSRNLNLQSKLVEYFRKKRADDARDTDKSVGDQETRYGTYMAQIHELRKEKDSFTSTNAALLIEIKEKIKEKLQEATSKSEEFVKYRKEIAKNSEISRTGKSLSSKIIEQLESQEDKKQKEVIAVRLDNIKLRNKIKRYEQMLRQKEELADGLHLIDFEQLKIENQTFNEKIEERNEDLLKLRKKITNVVQVLTHLKEKLQFVLEENLELKNDLAKVDEQVTAYRDSLPTLKSQRDELRNKSQIIRDKNGLLGNLPLLRDFEDKMTESKTLKSSIDALKEEYSALNKESSTIKKKMRKLEWALSV